MVRFRVYSYNSRTQPYSLRNLTKCLVMDASNNQIFDMKDIKFNDDGVYESQFMLASKVVFGFWSMTFTGPNDEVNLRM